jgi:hypothetical protein
VLDPLLPRAGLRSSAMLFVHVLFFLLLGTSVGALPIDHGPHFQTPFGDYLEEIHIDPDGRGYAKSQGTERVQIDHDRDLLSHPPLRFTGIGIHAGLWYRESTMVSRTSTNFHVSNTFHRVLIVVTISSRSVLQEQYTFTKWVKSQGK